MGKLLKNISYFIIIAIILIIFLIIIICDTHAFHMLLNCQFSFPFLYRFIDFDMDFIKKDPLRTLTFPTWSYSMNFLLLALQNLKKVIASRSNTPPYDPSSAIFYLKQNQ